MKVYKYPFECTDMFSIKLPITYKVLSVQTQHDTPYIWILVDETQEVTQVLRFRMAGTGNVLPSDIFMWKFVGTFQLHGGQLVFHLFCKEA